MDDLAQQASRATSVAIIRRKVLTEFERRGVRAYKVDALTVKLEPGGYMGLTNLVDRCLDVPVRYWTDCVEAHVETMLESQRLSDPEHLMSLPDDEFYMRLRERVTTPDNLLWTDAYAYSRPLVDGPHSPRRVLNLSFPSLALTVTDLLLSNRDLDAAWAFGRDNTASVKFEQCEALTKDDVTIDVRRGDSIYLASKTADMPRLVSAEMGASPFGVLFAIPNAYEIDYFLPREHDETVRAAALLGDVARMFSNNTPNPLSTEVYFWRDGQYCQVTGGSSAALFEETLAEI